VNKNAWYNALTHWHFVFLVAMAYVLWQVLARYRPRYQKQLEARLNYVNFFVGLSFGILCLACALYIYHPQKPEISVALLRVCFFVWTATVSVILLNSDLSRPIKVICFVLTTGAVPVEYIFDDGISGFLARLDGFIRLGGAVTGTGLTPRLLLKWSFFFAHGFVVLHYYGVMYEVGYREKVIRGEKKEGLQQDAIERAIVVLSMALAFFVALVLTGADIGKLSLFSGLVAAGVSIALRDLLANMAAGMLLLWDKSIKLADVISLDKERYGVVKGMTMRYLVLEDRNDMRFLIPNSDLINRTITNWTQNTRRIRLKLDFGVAYGSDIEKIRDIMKSVCLRNSRVSQDPPPKLLVVALGESTVNFQLRFFIEDPENGIRNVMSDIYEVMLDRFREAKISFPLPQREIRILDGALISGGPLSSAPQASMEHGIEPRMEAPLSQIG
jgi:small-conductance mechanosensitive channel